jgi:hypothetical protein
MAYGKRSFWVDPWHYCSRCDIKTHINQLSWQRGALLCKTCTDKMLLGQREIEISDVLGDGQQEFAPVAKLREPTVTETSDDILL